MVKSRDELLRGDVVLQPSENELLKFARDLEEKGLLKVVAQPLLKCPHCGRREHFDSGRTFGDDARRCLSCAINPRMEEAGISSYRVVVDFKHVYVRLLSSLAVGGVDVTVRGPGVADASAHGSTVSLVFADLAQRSEEPLEQPPLEQPALVVYSDPDSLRVMGGRNLLQCWSLSDVVDRLEAIGPGLFGALHDEGLEPSSFDLKRLYLQKVGNHRHQEPATTPLRDLLVLYREGDGALTPRAGYPKIIEEAEELDVFIDLVRPQEKKRVWTKFLNETDGKWVELPATWAEALVVVMFASGPINAEDFPLPLLGAESKRKAFDRARVKVEGKRGKGGWSAFLSCQSGPKRYLPDFHFDRSSHSYGAALPANHHLARWEESPVKHLLEAHEAEESDETSPDSDLEPS